MPRTAPYNASANLVSAFLTRNGHAKSLETPARVKGLPRITPGFQAYGHDGITRVDYTLGERLRYATTERRRERIRDELNAMEKTLSQRYTVTMFEPTEGTAYSLTVTAKTP